MIPLMFTLALLVAQVSDQEMRQFQSRIATIEAKLDALHEATEVAKQLHAKQGERLYELIRDNERLQSEKMLALKERQDRAEGKSSGISQGWGILLGLCSTGLAVAALLNARKRAT
jgi:hypothetical protein